MKRHGKIPAVVSPVDTTMLFLGKRVSMGAIYELSGMRVARDWDWGKVLKFVRVFELVQVSNRLNGVIRGWGMTDARAWGQGGDTFQLIGTPISVAGYGAQDHECSVCGEMHAA